MTGAHVLLIVVVTFTVLLFGMEWVVNRLFDLVDDWKWRR